MNGESPQNNQEDSSDTIEKIKAKSKELGAQVLFDIDPNKGLDEIQNIYDRTLELLESLNNEEKLALKNAENIVINTLDSLEEIKKHILHRPDDTQMNNEQIPIPEEPKFTAEQTDLKLLEKLSGAGIKIETVEALMNLCMYDEAEKKLMVRQDADAEHVNAYIRDVVLPTLEGVVDEHVAPPQEQPEPQEPLQAPPEPAPEVKPVSGAEENPHRPPANEWSRLNNILTESGINLETNRGQFAKFQQLNPNGLEEKSQAIKEAIESFPYKNLLKTKFTAIRLGYPKFEQDSKISIEDNKLYIDLGITKQEITDFLTQNFVPEPAVPAPAPEPTPAPEPQPAKAEETLDEAAESGPTPPEPAPEPSAEQAQAEPPPPPEPPPQPEPEIEDHFFSDDPYEVLGVPLSATLDEVKATWRALMIKFHPDKNNSDPKYAEASKRINAAYQKICDDRKWQAENFAWTNQDQNGGFGAAPQPEEEPAGPGAGQAGAPPQPEGAPGPEKPLSEQIEDLRNKLAQMEAKGQNFDGDTGRSFEDLEREYLMKQEARAEAVKNEMRTDAGMGPLTQEQEAKLQSEINDRLLDELTRPEYKAYKQAVDNNREKTALDKSMEGARKILNTKVGQWYMGLSWEKKLLLSTALITGGAYLLGAGLAGGALFGGKRLIRGALSFGGSTAVRAGVQKVVSIDSLNKKREEKLGELKKLNLSYAEKAKRTREIEEEYDKKIKWKKRVETTTAILAGAGTAAIVGLAGEGIASGQTSGRLLEGGTGGPKSQSVFDRMTTKMANAISGQDTPPAMPKPPVAVTEQDVGKTYANIYEANAPKVEPIIKPEALVHDVEAGDSSWKILKGVLETNEQFKGMTEAQKTYVLSTLTNKIIQDPESYGLSEGGTLNVGNKTDFTKLFEDTKEIKSIFDKARQTIAEGSPQEKSILLNNAKIAEWVKGHPDEVLNEDKVTEILNAKPKIEIAEPGDETLATEPNVPTGETYGNAAEIGVSDQELANMPEEPKIPEAEIPIEIPEPAGPRVPEGEGILQQDENIPSRPDRLQFAGGGAAMAGMAAAKILEKGDGGKSEKLPNDLQKQLEAEKTDRFHLQEKIRLIQDKMRGLLETEHLGAKDPRILELEQQKLQAERVLALWERAHPNKDTLTKNAEPLNLQKQLEAEIMEAKLKLEGLEAGKDSLEKSGLRTMTSDISHNQADMVLNSTLEEAFKTEIDHIYGKSGFLGLGKVSGLNTEEWGFMARLPAGKIVEYYIGDSAKSDLNPDIVEALSKSKSHQNLIRQTIGLIEQTKGSVRPYANENMEQFIKRIGGFVLKTHTHTAQNLSKAA